MTRLFLIALILAASVGGVAAAPKVSVVPRPAADFAFAGPGAKKSLRSLRGQPVVLVIAKSPKSRAFRKQIKAFTSIYQEFASRKVVFAAAFTEEEGEILSNIPFVIATNPAAVAAAYDFQDDIVVAIIGRDGNLDLISGKQTAAFRVREVIQNSFVPQNEARKETPKGPLPPTTPPPAAPTR